MTFTFNQRVSAIGGPRAAIRGRLVALTLALMALLVAPPRGPAHKSSTEP
jgi:hypothetical protein